MINNKLLDMNYINEETKEYLKETYSTSEVKTNKVWIDGKPIYRKVKKYSKAANTSSSTIQHGITNLDFLLSAQAMAVVGGQFRPLPSFYSPDISTYNQSIYYIDGTDIGIYYSTWYAARASEIYIILEYTKAS